MDNNSYLEAKKILDDALNNSCQCVIRSNVLYIRKPDETCSEDNRFEWDIVLKELYSINEYFIVDIGCAGVAFAIEHKSDYIDNNPNHKLVLKYTPSFWHRPPESQFEETITISDGYISYKKDWLIIKSEDYHPEAVPKINVYWKLDIYPFDKHRILFEILSAFMKEQYVDVCDGDFLEFHCYFKGKKVKYSLIPCANVVSCLAIKKALLPYLSNVPCPEFLDFNDEYEE